MIGAPRLRALAPGRTCWRFTVVRNTPAAAIGREEFLGSVTACGRDFAEALAEADRRARADRRWAGEAIRIGLIVRRV